MSALSDAITATASAGWQLPLEVKPLRTVDPVAAFRLGDDPWCVTEADGTLVAICGVMQDADLVCAALHHALDSGEPKVVG